MFKCAFKLLIPVLLIFVSCSEEKAQGEFLRHYELIVRARTSTQTDMFRYPCSTAFWTFIHDQNIRLEKQKIVYEMTTDVDPRDRQSVYAKGLNEFVIDKYKNHLDPGLDQARELVVKSIAEAKAMALKLDSLKDKLEPGFKPYAEYSIIIICKDPDGILSDYEIYSEYGENHSWIIENVKELNF